MYFLTIKNPIDLALRSSQDDGLIFLLPLNIRKKLRRKRYREQTYGHGGEGRREKGKEEMYGENNMEIYNTICKIGG